MKVLSAQQMRDLEQAAVGNGATYIKLMEKAGTAAAEALIKYGAESKKVVIICGKGNNGFIKSTCYHTASSSLMTATAKISLTLLPLNSTPPILMLLTLPESVNLIQGVSQRIILLSIAVRRLRRASFVEY